MAKIKQSKKREAFIPTGSMSDIAFLLLLFFMVSTVFVQEKKFWVERDAGPLPKASSAFPATIPPPST